jgi:prevent-host-death family protein
MNSGPPAVRATHWIGARGPALLAHVDLASPHFGATIATPSGGSLVGGFEFDMKTIDITDTTKTLSKLVAAVETGAEQEVVIMRNGKPVARLVPLEGRKGGVRLGLARGRFEVPDNIDADKEEIAKMFYGEDD